MEREKQLEIQTQIEELNDLIDLLHLTGKSSKREDTESKIKKKIADIKSKITSSKDHSSRMRRLSESFEESVKAYKELLQILQEEAKAEQNNPIDTFQEEELDFETMQKMKDLEAIKDMNFLSKELVIKQNMINQKLKEDSENIDELLVHTEETVENGNKANKQLAEAAAYERKKRLLAFQAGGTAVGGLLGNVFGAIGGLFVTNRISSWVGKKHQKKIDKLVKIEEEGKKQ